VPQLTRDDGVEIHWEESGSGPLVVFAPYCTSVPAVYDGMAGELAADHRLVRYDSRGAGESSRQGPYDMETGAADVAAVIEAAGGPAVVIGLGDGCNHGVRVAARQPELVDAVVATGGMPVGRHRLGDSDAMVNSETVVGAFIAMFETDYRGAVRSLTTAGNPQMSEDEIRERVTVQVEYQSHEAAVARIRAWAEDDAYEEARACGERLWLQFAEEMGGGWFPAGQEAIRLARELWPDAHVSAVEDGIVSRPDLTAEIVRRVTAPVIAGGG
jgi:pimeloyl-ACP methyl ester carboxylesterase